MSTCAFILQGVPKCVPAFKLLYDRPVQVRRLIVFRRQMFGRIFAISDRVRAYFAPVRVLSRVAERRAKKICACVIDLTQEE